MENMELFHTYTLLLLSADNDCVSSYFVFSWLIINPISYAVLSNFCNSSSKALRFQVIMTTSSVYALICTTLVDIYEHISPDS